jgi:hypothetical protein
MTAPSDAETGTGRCQACPEHGAPPGSEALSIRRSGGQNLSESQQTGTRSTGALDGQVSDGPMAHNVVAVFASVF